MKLLTWFLFITLSLDFLHPAISAERVENNIEVLSLTLVSESKKVQAAVQAGKRFPKIPISFFYKPEVLLPKLPGTPIYLKNRAFLI